MRLCGMEGGGGEIVKGKAQHTHTHTHTNTPSFVYNQGGISLSSPDLLAMPHGCALLQASAEYNPHCSSGRHRRDTAGQFEVCPVWREVHVGCVWERGQILLLHTRSHNADNLHPPLPLTQPHLPPPSPTHTTLPPRPLSHSNNLTAKPLKWESLQSLPRQPSYWEDSCSLCS